MYIKKREPHGTSNVRTLGENCVQRVVQKQGGSVIFWGFFTYSDLDLISEVNRTLNQHRYTQILAEHV